MSTKTTDSSKPIDNAESGSSQIVERDAVGEC